MGIFIEKSKKIGGNFTLIACLLTCLPEFCVPLLLHMGLFVDCNCVISLSYSRVYVLVLMLV